MLECFLSQSKRIHYYNNYPSQPTTNILRGQISLATALHVLTITPPNMSNMKS